MCKSGEGFTFFNMAIREELFKQVVFKQKLRGFGGGGAGGRGAMCISREEHSTQRE